MQLSVLVAITLFLANHVHAQSLEWIRANDAVQIIAPNDSTDPGNTAVTSPAGWLFRYLCYQRGLNNNGQCSSTSLSKESVSIPETPRIYVGQHSTRNLGRANEFLQVIESLSSNIGLEYPDEDGFLFAYLPDSRQFFILSPGFNTEKQGLRNGVATFLENFLDVTLSFPISNPSIALRSDTIGLNDTIPLFVNRSILVSQSQFNYSIPTSIGTAWISYFKPEIKNRLFSTNILASPGIPAFPMSYRLSSLSSRSRGKQSITHGEAQLLRPLTLPNGSATPESFNAIPVFYSTKTVPSLSAPNANPPWRPCYSAQSSGQTVSQSMANTLQLNFIEGRSVSVAINDSGQLCADDTFLSECSSQSGRILFPSSLTSLERTNRSVSCHYFNHLTKIDQTLSPWQSNQNLSISFMMHAFLRDFDHQWTFLLSSIFKSVYIPSDEAQAEDPKEYAEQFAPQTSVIAKTAKTFPNQSIGIYNYLAEPGFIAPRFFIESLTALIKSRYNTLSKIDGIYSEFYPNPNSLPDQVTGYVFSKLIWNPSLDPKALKEEYLSKTYGPLSGFFSWHLERLENDWNSQFHLNDSNHPDYQKRKVISEYLVKTGQTSRSLYRWMGSADQFAFFDEEACLRDAKYVESQVSLYPFLKDRLEAYLSYLKPVCYLGHRYRAWFLGQQLKSKIITGGSPNDTELQEILRLFAVSASEDSKKAISDAFKLNLRSSLTPFNIATKRMFDAIKSVIPLEGIRWSIRKWFLGKSFINQAQLLTQYSANFLEKYLSFMTTESRQIFQRMSPIVIESLPAPPNFTNQGFDDSWGVPQVYQQKLYQPLTLIYGNTYTTGSGNTLSGLTLTLYLKRHQDHFYVGISANSTSPVAFAPFPSFEITPTPLLLPPGKTMIKDSPYKASRQFIRMIVRKDNGVSNSNTRAEPNLDIFDFDPLGILAFNERSLRSTQIENYTSFIESGCRGQTPCRWSAKFAIKATSQLLLPAPSAPLSQVPLLSTGNFSTNQDIGRGIEVNVLYWPGSEFGYPLYPQGFEYYNSTVGSWLSHPMTDAGFPVSLSLSRSDDMTKN